MIIGPSASTLLPCEDECLGGSSFRVILATEVSLGAVAELTVADAARVSSASAVARRSGGRMPAVTVATTGSPARVFTPTEAQIPPGHWVLVPRTPSETQSPASHTAVVPVGSSGGSAGRIVVILSSVVNGSKVVTGATPPKT